MRLHGGQSVIRVTTGIEYDVETSTMVNTVTTFNVETVVMDYTQKFSGFGTESTLVKTGDKQVFVKVVDGLPVPVAGRDTLILSGEDFSIVSVKEINPSGIKAYVYEIFARQ